MATALPRILLLSPARNIEKHPANPLALSQRFLNFGLLSLGSYLNQSGYPTTIRDEYVCDSIFDAFKESPPDVIGISCISAYSADRVAEILSAVRSLWPHTIRVIGGQHFVGLWGPSFAHRMPDADVLIAGESEGLFLRFLELLSANGGLQRIPTETAPRGLYWKVDGTIKSGTAHPPSLPAMDSLAVPDYHLYPGSQELFPSIEFSRGCQYACVFCANSRANRLNFRRAGATTIAAAARSLLEHRPNVPLQFYMQASNFSVSLAEARELELNIASLPIEWRTEIRVDSVPVEAVASLARSGLRVLDVGLESASLRTLRVMNKTRDPEAYLRTASDLLEAARDSGVFTKVNYLIHPGDSMETVSESWDWMRARQELIGAVSSGVTLEYPGTPLSLHLSYYEREFGTRRLPHPLERWGVYNLQPSHTLSHVDAEAIAIEIGQSLQTRSDFAFSKTFGYLATNASERAAALAQLPEASHATPYRSDSTRDVAT